MLKRKKPKERKRHWKGGSTNPRVYYVKKGTRESIRSSDSEEETKEDTGTPGHPPKTLTLRLEAKSFLAYTPRTTATASSQSSPGREESRRQPLPADLSMVVRGSEVLLNSLSVCEDSTRRYLRSRALDAPMSCVLG